MTHTFREFKKHKGDIETRSKGSLTSGEQGPATSFALNRLQEREDFLSLQRKLFIKGK